jgi:alkaline phosphatase D
LIDLHLLDTRQYRSDQPCGDGNKAGCTDADRSAATMLGQRQETWLYDGLATGRARWNLLAQQVMMMPLDRRSDGSDGPPIAGLDTWSGATAARRRLVDHVNQRGLKNVVVATGDEHRNCAGEIKDATGRTAMVEFVGTSITSGGDGADRSPAIDRILARNPHCRFINNQRGYLACDVNAKRWRTEFKVLDQVSAPGGTLSTRAAFSVAAGEAALHEG